VQSLAFTFVGFQQASMTSTRWLACDAQFIFDHRVNTFQSLFALTGRFETSLWEIDLDLTIIQVPFL
jgi:hypothetical protein